MESDNLPVFSNTAVMTRPLAQISEPPLYQVLLHNDDFTPMDFVVDVLENVFHKDSSIATKIMMDVHRKGVGVAGIYALEIAETKVEIVREQARRKEYPLLCTTQKNS